MPRGVPVGTLAIGESGATNAAILAASILAAADRYPEIETGLKQMRASQTSAVTNEPVLAHPVASSSSAAPSSFSSASLGTSTTSLSALCAGISGSLTHPALSQEWSSKALPRGSGLCVLVVCVVVCACALCELQRELL
jgi:phosphoribosylcarboxyaminoimidazole (NCAIR) mutase